MLSAEAVAAVPVAVVPTLEATARAFMHRSIRGTRWLGSAIANWRRTAAVATRTPREVWHKQKSKRVSTRLDEERTGAKW